MAKLTPKQAKFVDEYLVDLNATQAAIRSGYSKRSAMQIGEQNLRKLDIKTLIDKEKARRSKVVQYTAQDVLKDLVRIARFDIRELYNEEGELKLPHEWSDDAAMVISSVDSNIMRSSEADVQVAIKKVKIEARTKAIELAGRHVDTQAFDNSISLEVVPHVSRNFTGRKVAGLE